YLATITTALSVTSISASTIPPISTDDYEIEHTEGREDAVADIEAISNEGVDPFPNVMIPAEIGMPTLRTAKVDIVKNNEALEISLDLSGRDHTKSRKHWAKEHTGLETAINRWNSACGDRSNRQGRSNMGRHSIESTPSTRHHLSRKRIGYGSKDITQRGPLTCDIFPDLPDRASETSQANDREVAPTTTLSGE
nr:hypothetical protein [Tanacetum cinerariifolium]